MRTLAIATLLAVVQLHVCTVECFGQATSISHFRRVKDAVAAGDDTFHASQRKSAQWLQVSRGGASSSPKLSQWIGPALSSALSYASYNIFIKLGSSNISPMLGGVILQTIAALLGTCLLGASREKVAYDRKGIMWSAFAGVAVGAAELLSFQVSTMGVEASRSTPIMIGGSVAIGSILGAVLLKERMSVKGWFGVFLVVAGIACVATDPGASLAGH